MTAQLSWAFSLLILFQVKHFIGDFPLQVPYMLRKVLPSWRFFVPLAIHCMVHGLMTLAIVLVVKPQLWWLAIVDFVAHFLMDRIKSGPRYFGRYNDKSSAMYWNVFGFDQMVHHLTGIYIVWALIQN